MVRAQLGRSGDNSLFAARREGRTVQRHWTVLVRDSVCSEQARSVRASASAFPRVVCWAAVRVRRAEGLSAVAGSSAPGTAGPRGVCVMPCGGDITGETAHV